MPEYVKSAKGQELMRDFEEPVKMADGSQARLKHSEFMKGDIPCDKCKLTIFAMSVRWIIDDGSTEYRYHFRCYQPVIMG